MENSKVFRVDSATISLKDGMHMEKKTFLECMFNDLDNLSEGTDEEVEQELMEMGIDIEKDKDSFYRTIRKIKENK